MTRTDHLSWPANFALLWRLPVRKSLVGLTKSARIDLYGHNVAARTALNTSGFDAVSDVALTLYQILIECSHLGHNVSCCVAQPVLQIVAHGNGVVLETVTWQNMG